MLVKLAIALCTLPLSVASVYANATQLTIYDDGLSCPGGCDAHVVFHPAMNGTDEAHAVPPNPKSAKCALGEPCELCFDGDPTQCIVVTYRGSGPPTGRFDFTPAFYKQKCAEADLPKALSSACKDLRSSARKWVRRTSCIANSNDPACKSRMKIARDLSEQDQPRFAHCKESGESVFNSPVPEFAQRAENCAYEKFGTGRNSRGETWRRLLPAVCRPGTFVGRDGLDCCSGDPLTDSGFGPRECAGYYIPAPANPRAP